MLLPHFPISVERRREVEGEAELSDTIEIGDRDEIKGVAGELFTGVGLVALGEIDFLVIQSEGNLDGGGKFWEEACWWPP